VTGVTTVTGGFGNHLTPWVALTSVGGMSKLRWDVHVSPMIPVVTDDLAPGTTERRWSPISSVLIMGDHDAVLVDPPLTIDQAESVVNWVEKSARNLTTVYATHGHGDHCFGAGALLERFPQARFVATPDAIGVLRQQTSARGIEGFWAPRFPGQIPGDLVVAEPLTGPFALEGHELVPVELGHTDTEHTTCLHVPSIGLVVAGDAVYNDVHLYLAESAGTGRASWLAALDVIEALDPEAVVAGHKRDGRPDHPSIVAETRQYLHDFDRVFGTTMTARELYDAMMAYYPERVNPGALWTSARALRP
jgi:glyoxylase-like metal-dependent hydrolase (beta-lactamase superfamily II)